MAGDRRSRATGPRGTAREDADLRRRARMHAALGEPVRLAMVERLLVTDASPGELGAAHGLATNVLAHHVKVLRAAGLVRRVRSEGDARRAYLQLRLDDPEVLILVDHRSPGGPQPVERAAQIGPGDRAVRIGPGDRAVQIGPGRPVRVVFVCTQNSARSQLAAAAWHRVSRVPVTSAGTHPAPRVHPRAVAAGRRHGLRIDDTRTTRLTEIAGSGDLIVCVCDSAHEELTTGGDDALAGVPMAGSLHWAVPDPVRVDTDEAFETAYTEIAGRVGRLARTVDPLPVAGRT